MNEHEGQQGATSEPIADDKGPTEKLRDDAKPQSEQFVPVTEVPGAQKPGNEEIKHEINPNTE